MKIIDRFEIPYYQYLNENRQLADEIPPLAENIATLLKLYRLMVLVRLLDAKAIALQRTGKLGTYPSTRGQEAAFVGVGYAMDQRDIYLPYYRDVGVLLQRGINFSQILQYWGGDERGNYFYTDCEDFPYSVPVGSQLLHATGVAYALKYREEKRAVVVSCGDGATSQGDFYEAMNIAGVWKLPVVFVVCNNQWAISVSRQVQTATHTLAQKAIAAGFQGEQVDGNDVIAVAHRTGEALKIAREKNEPRLLEMVCYRHHDHTTADDATRYEPKELREQEWKKEPIARLRGYLKQLGHWDEQQEEDLRIDCNKKVEEIANKYVAIDRQSFSSMMDYLYFKLPTAYQEQRELLVEMEKSLHG